MRMCLSTLRKQKSQMNERSVEGPPEKKLLLEGGQDDVQLF